VWLKQFQYHLVNPNQTTALPHCVYYLVTPKHKTVLHNCMFPSVLPFFQRTPTTVGVLGFQARRTVGVTRAVLHFYFGDLNKRKRMQIRFYIPDARSKLGGCDISRSVRRRLQQLRWSDLLLWSSGQAHCLVGGLTKRAVLKCWKENIYGRNSFGSCCNPKQWECVWYTVLRSVEARTEMLLPSSVGSRTPADRLRVGRSGIWFSRWTASYLRLDRRFICCYDRLVSAPLFMEKHTNPRNRNVFNSLTDAKLGKKFPVFNGTQRFMILFKQADRWSYKTPDDLTHNQKAYWYAINWR